VEGNKIAGGDRSEGRAMKGTEGGRRNKVRTYDSNPANEQPK